MDRTAFFAALRGRACTLFGAALSQGQVDTLGAILDEAVSTPLPVSHVAYCMATAYHEVGQALKPVRENLTYTSASRIRAVWPSRFKSDAAAAPYVRQPQKLANLVYGGRLGNTAPNDGWTYRGGGLPQTTGKDGYRKVGQMIGVDLAADPERILEPRLAVAALVLGARFGIYTGRKLSDYLPGDYVGARAIINGDVKANGEKVAGYARQFEAALTAAGYAEAPLSPPSPPPTAPVAPPPAEPAPAKPQPMPQQNLGPQPDLGPQPEQRAWQAILATILALFKR